MSVKTYPTVEELSVTCHAHICPECLSIFKTEPNLILHRSKTHKVNELSLSKGSERKIYHCPITSCDYHSSKSFPQFKLIKQHFLKVHSAKKFLCEKCNEGFATQAYKNRHVEYCNVIFKCKDCAAFYWSYETLKTHSRRKKHQILKKEEYKPTAIESSTKSPNKKLKLILPKASIDKSDVCKVEFKTNTGTQTVAEISISSSVSTQTDFITNSHTSTSDLLITETFDSNFFNCNIETQTDFMLNDELFKCCDYYSNMHTQTCEDLLMEFSHSETQTPFDLKSVESQTVSGSSNNNPSLSNMETQTDLEFQQFLDEINS